MDDKDNEDNIILTERYNSDKKNRYKLETIESYRSKKNNHGLTGNFTFATLNNIYDFHTYRRRKQMNSIYPANNMKNLFDKREKVLLDENENEN